MSDLSDKSDKSDKSTIVQQKIFRIMPFLKQGGGYRSLKAFQITEAVYDIAYHFSHKYLRGGDRTVDQIIQAARSGKQNIAEGSAASTTSKETEIKLTNVALSSLQELLLDFEDYLRVRKLEKWGPSYPRYEPLRNYVKTADFMKEYPSLIEKLNDEELANMSITLIHQADYLLRRLLVAQQEQFLAEGGIREQMTRARINRRNSEKK